MSKVSDALGEGSSGVLDSLRYELHSTQQKYEAATNRIVLLEKMLADAAEEIHCFVNELYRYRDNHPHEMKRWERDMEIVNEIHAVLDDK